MFDASHRLDNHSAPSQGAENEIAATALIHRTPKKRSFSIARRGYPQRKPVQLVATGTADSYGKIDW